MRLLVYCSAWVFSFASVVFVDCKTFFGVRLFGDFFLRPICCWGFLPSNDHPVYIHRNSNHPPNIIRSLPASISRRISAISHDEVIFKKAYSNESKRCNLCLTEKLIIINTDKRTLLNKRPELISKCRHENKFYIYNSSPTTKPPSREPHTTKERAPKEGKKTPTTDRTQKRIHQQPNTEESLTIPQTERTRREYPGRTIHQQPHNPR
ncbi:hypothetical protein BSL78_28957 [Apostichopus japonicus]|uniref:Uncharacterized protein n=1 Tax=Stichopus japonicus TaxID=307972 RepID=A0A2G8JEQ8_STIJA|nr:hypothetical protein BSL78_28957 [Apostichopus japonicus]